MYIHLRYNSKPSAGLNDSFTGEYLHILIQKKQFRLLGTYVGQTVNYNLRNRRAQFKLPLTWKTSLINSTETSIIHLTGMQHGGGYVNQLIVKFCVCRATTCWSGRIVL
jgi:hypothetical protein